MKCANENIANENIANIRNIRNIETLETRKCANENIANIIIITIAQGGPGDNPQPRTPGLWIFILSNP